ncbi:MAG: hypothetical protein IJK64_02015 [Clostridia bacterium]|nr:hypothetical protein [Clostridia bacterium]
MDLKLLLKQGRGLLKYLARALVFCLPAVYIVYLIGLLVIAARALGGADPAQVMESAFTGLFSVTSGIVVLIAFVGLLLGLDLVVFRRTAKETAILHLMLQIGMLPVAAFGALLYGISMFPAIISAGFLAVLSVPTLIPAVHLLAAAILIPGLQTVGAAIRLFQLKTINLGWMLVLILTAFTFVVAPVLSILLALAVLCPQKYPALAHLFAPKERENGESD